MSAKSPRTSSSVAVQGRLPTYNLVIYLQFLTIKILMFMIRRSHAESAIQTVNVSWLGFISALPVPGN
jgi:hypothetical protein